MNINFNEIIKRQTLIVLACAGAVAFSCTASVPALADQTSQPVRIGVAAQAIHNALERRAALLAAQPNRSAIQGGVTVNNPTNVQDLSNTNRPTGMQPIPEGSIYGGSFYRRGQMPANLTMTGGTGFGINSRFNQFGSPNGLTIPVRMPNGIGATGRSYNQITPYGTGANGPMGTYGGNSFGSSAGGSVR